MSAGAEGLVIAAHGRNFMVRDAGGVTRLCVTRGRKNEIACGDRVAFTETAVGQGVIDQVLPRTNLFYRSDAFKAKRLAANLTQVCIVVAAEPPFSEDLLGRALVAAEVLEIPGHVILNKTDLAVLADQARARLVAYTALGYTIHEVSARALPEHTRTMLDAVVHGHTTLFLGQSGMGKSTLLNLLVPDAMAATREISEVLHSGKHTTTDARLYALPDGSGAIIDTPGFQEFGLGHLSPGEIERAFPDLRPFLGHCRFYNCSHLAEPGCAVREAVASGALGAARYALFTALTQQSVGPWKPSRVKRLASADNVLVATLWLHVLESAGVACTLRNHFIAGALGEIPSDHARPEVWVNNERDYAMAQQVLREVREPNQLPWWHCAQCGEPIEGQFFQCWQCQASRP